MEGKAEPAIKLRIAYFLVHCPNQKIILLRSILDTKEMI